MRELSESFKPMIGRITKMTQEWQTPRDFFVDFIDDPKD